MFIYNTTYSLIMQLEHCVVNGQAHMDLEDRGDEVYIPPHVPYVAFGGAGSALGGPAVAAEGATMTAEAVQAASAPVFSDAEPSTTLQIRTHDGKKLRIKYVAFTIYFKPISMINIFTSPFADTKTG